MRPVLSTLRRAAPYVFIVALYAGMGTWVRWYRMGPDWGHYLTSARILLYGRHYTLPTGGTLSRTQYYSFSMPSVFGPIVLPQGPVGTIVIMPFVLLCDAAGWGMNFAAISIIPWLAYLVFDVLAACELRRAVKRLRPEGGEAVGLFVFAVFLSSWIAFFNSPYHAHFESILIYFMLVALRLDGAGSHLRSGALWGMALLTKPTAVLGVITQAAILIRRRRWVGIGQLLAVAAAVVLVVLAPFLIGDFRNAFYALVHAPLALPIEYMNIWWAFFTGLPRSHWAVVAVESWANPVSLVLGALAAGLFAWRRRIEPGSAANYGLTAFVSILVLMFLKWGSLHYYLLPFALLVVWEVACHRWPWISLVYVGALSNVFILAFSGETRAGVPGVRPPGIVLGWQSSWILIAVFVGTLLWLGLNLGKEHGAGTS